MDEFRLGKPAIVCRWRLANGKLPLENRHLRALSARRTNNNLVTTGLIAWAKQHIEWTLAEGSAAHPDGVLMLVVDENGKAAMSVGAYTMLEHTSANDLLRRANNARREGEELGVSPEDLWVVRNDALVWGIASGCKPAGVSSLISDLAHTLGIPVAHDEELLHTASVRGFGRDEVFLASDEHGVVPASDHSGLRAQKFADSYKKLLQK